MVILRTQCNRILNQNIPRHLFGDFYFHQFKNCGCKVAEAAAFYGVIIFIYQENRNRIGGVCSVRTSVFVNEIIGIAVVGCYEERIVVL